MLKLHPHTNSRPYEEVWDMKPPDRYVLLLVDILTLRDDVYYSDYIQVPVLFYGPLKVFFCCGPFLYIVRQVQSGANGTTSV